MQHFPDHLNTLHEMERSILSPEPAPRCLPLFVPPSTPALECPCSPRGAGSTMPIAPWTNYHSDDFVWLGDEPEGLRKTSGPKVEPEKFRLCVAAAIWCIHMNAKPTEISGISCSESMVLRCDVATLLPAIQQAHQLLCCACPCAICSSRSAFVGIHLGVGEMRTRLLTS